MDTRNGSVYVGVSRGEMYQQTESTSRVPTDPPPPTAFALQAPKLIFSLFNFLVFMLLRTVRLHL